MRLGHNLVSKLNRQVVEELLGRFELFLDLSVSQVPSDSLHQFLRQVVLLRELLYYVLLVLELFVFHV